MKELKELEQQVADLIEENEKLRRGLDIYKRERIRFRHSYPEITGNYFISGELGKKDDNFLPEYILVCPAYGADWSILYKKMEKTHNDESGEDLGNNGTD